MVGLARHCRRGAKEVGRRPSGRDPEQGGDQQDGEPSAARGPPLRRPGWAGCGGRRGVGAASPMSGNDHRAGRFQVQQGLTADLVGKVAVGVPAALAFRPGLVGRRIGIGPAPANSGRRASPRTIQRCDAIPRANTRRRFFRARCPNTRNGKVGLVPVLLAAGGETADPAVVGQGHLPASVQHALLHGASSLGVREDPRRRRRRCGGGRAAGDQDAGERRDAGAARERRRIHAGRRISGRTTPDAWKETGGDLPADCPR